MSRSKKQPSLTPAQSTALLATLRERFEKNMHLHKSISWAVVEKKLLRQPSALWSLHEMERTGGEPDVTGYDKSTDEFIFCDCAPESPAGRRSLCYDRVALDSRKEHQPENSAIDLAAAIGIEMLDEAQYRALQQLGTLDTKTSSWIKTPDAIRKLGGAIFGDYRYGQVFIYHNGASSYYAARGFRGMLRV